MLDRIDALAHGGKRIESRVDTDHLRAVLDARRLVDRYGTPVATDTRPAPEYRVWLAFGEARVW
jgi:hypothetical protein